MKRRELWMGALALVLCGLPFIGIEWNRKLALQRERADPAFPHKNMLRHKFASIQPKDGKVLMVPGPSLRPAGYNTDLYTLSLPKNGYWKKPRLVDVGFKFGYFSGAKDYEYEILAIREHGVRMSYFESGLPVGVGPRVLEMPWK